MRVVHESETELVVWKPAGIASELTNDPGTSMLAALRREHGPELRLCHRLDRPTCGFVVVAKTKEAAAWHGAGLAAREWRKVYVAKAPVVPLGKHRAYLKETNRRAEIVRSGGQVAWLEVLAWRDGHALIELFTGRRHQIRVMLAGLGAPLIGDTLYGGRPGELFLEHAWLSFPLPTGERKVCCDADAPVFGGELRERG